MTKFYDTSSMLADLKGLLKEDKIVYSSITLKELERIKTSSSKDEEVKYAARQLLSILENNPNNFYCYIYNENMLKPIIEHNLEITDDMKILASALSWDNLIDPDETIFFTNDLLLKNIANLFFGNDSVKTIAPIYEEYLGFKHVFFSPEEWEDFYYHMTDNKYAEKLNLNINEYICINNGEHPDVYKWNGEEFVTPCAPIFSSKQLGNIRPEKNDIYQIMAADSLISNQITMIKGPAGSGKSTLALGYLFYLLEKNKINKIIIFCNTVATKNSAKLGFYPGDRNSKLLDSQIGNFLSSKLGDRLAIEQLIQENKLILLPMADCRGYDTSGMNAGIYIPEAQNFNISLIKLALQRVGQDSICILDGDDKTQVDLVEYEGYNNGMRRVSEVFRGKNIYGEVTLQKIHRSKIAEIAEEL